MVMIKAIPEDKENKLQKSFGEDLVYIADKVGALQITNYEKYYTELNNAGIHLDDDPTQYGLKHLNEQIARIDSQKNRISYLLTKAIKNENDIDQVCSLIDRTYKKRRSETLLTKEVTELASQNLRDAAVEKELSGLLDQQNDIQQCLSKAKTFTKIVKQAFDALEGTNRNISRQITIIQAMIELGEVARRER